VWAPRVVTSSVGRHAPLRPTAYATVEGGVARLFKASARTPRPTGRRPHPAACCGTPVQRQLPVRIGTSVAPEGKVTWNCSSAARSRSFLAVGVAYVGFAVDHRAHFEVMFRPDLYHPDDPEVATARQLAALSERGDGAQVLTGARMPAGHERRTPVVAAAVEWRPGKLCSSWRCSSAASGGLLTPYGRGQY
jgi:hypothetical protein